MSSGVMTVTGQCFCGAIRYEAQLDPAAVGICHCSDCQSLSGSAFRTVAFAPEHGFKLLSGTPTVFVKTAESGRRREQTFCPTCGSPLYARGADAPMASAPPADGAAAPVLGIRVGTIHQRDRLVPRVQYYCRSAQPWATAVDGAVRLEGGGGSRVLD